ncbi:unnamed protein product [Amoebophrya sp. A25]|nr:unnamed protein product [Amoebophrya sp. A25]|eukprot:GSA25T00016922001.1
MKIRDARAVDREQDGTSDVVDDRKVAVIRGVRALNSLGLGLLASSRTNLTYKVVTTAGKVDRRGVEVGGGVVGDEATSSDHHATVAAFAVRVTQICSVVDLFLSPLIGRIMDTKGRVETMALALTSMGIAKLVLAYVVGSTSTSVEKMKKLAFLAHHLVVWTMLPAFVRGSSTWLQDMFGHGSREATQQQMTTIRTATYVGILGNFLGSRLMPYQKQPERAYACYGVIALFAAGLVQFLCGGSGNTTTGRGKLQIQIHHDDASKTQKEKVINKLVEDEEDVELEERSSSGEPKQVIEEAASEQNEGKEPQQQASESSTTGLSNSSRTSSSLITNLLKDSNPIFFFGQSTTLRALAVVLLSRVVPIYVHSLDSVYLRKKFGEKGWGGGNENRSEVFMRLSMALNTCLVVAAMDLDTHGSPAWKNIRDTKSCVGKLLFIIRHLADAVVTNLGLRSIVKQGTTTEQRREAQEPEGADAGGQDGTIAEHPPEPGDPQEVGGQNRRCIEEPKQGTEQEQESLSSATSNQDFQRLLQFHAVLEIVGHLGTRFSKSPGKIQALHMLTVLHFGGDSLDRLFQKEAGRLKLGQGVLAAQQGNLLFFASLLMPSVFTKLFQLASRTKNRFLAFLLDPYIVAALLEASNCFLVIPWAYRQMNKG